MNSIFKTLTQKTIAIVITVCIVSFATASLVAYKQASETLVHKEIEEIGIFSHEATISFTDFLSKIETDIEHYAASDFITESYKSIRFFWNQTGGNTDDRLRNKYIFDNPNPIGEKDVMDVPEGATDSYDLAHRDFHPTIRDFLKRNGYYDIFLLNLEGDVIYSVFKELDYATNVVDGEYAETDLGNVFRSVVDNPDVDAIAFTDFAPYAPSANAPASFVAKALTDNKGEKIGVVVFQMPVDEINTNLNRLNADSHMVYLVGEDGLLRNDLSSTEVNDILTTPSPFKPDTSATEVFIGNGSGLLSADVDWMQSEIEFHGTRWWTIIEADKELLLYSSLREMVQQILLIGIPVLLALMAGTWLVVRSQMNPIGALAIAVKDVVAGKDADVPAQDRTDELGDLARSFLTVHEKMIQSQQIETAVDASSSSLMILNPDKSVAFVNTALQDALNESATYFETEHSTSPKEGLSGTKVGDFLPEFQPDQIDKQTISFDGRVFDVTPSKILGADGTERGMVMEWLERTEVIALETQIADIIKGATEGQFDKSIESSSSDPFMKLVSEGINDLSQITKSFLSSLSSVLDSVIQGDLSNKMSVEFKGDFEAAASGLNSAISDLEAEHTKSGRVSTGLDSIELPMMISDTDGKIVFVNTAFASSVGWSSDYFEKHIPDFDAQELEGRDVKALYDAIDCEFNNESNETVSHTIDFAERKFVIKTTAAVGEDGEVIGQCSEWQDVTSAAKIEEEIAKVIEGAAAGDFSKRIELETRDSFRATVVSGVNQVSDIVSGFLDESQVALRALADGDLSKTIESEYNGQFGEAVADINTSIENLRDLIAQVKSSASELDQSSTTASTDARELASKAEKQAVSIEQTSAALEEISITTKNTCELANTASDSAESATNKVGQGQKVAEAAVDAMQKIEENSAQISEVTKVVNSIAFQTNLLALNASVEAARAGEAGKGFAVVANEVRALAGQSQKASEDIGELINSSTKSVGNGVKLVTRTGEALTEIQTAIEEMTNYLDEIQNGNKEQTVGITEISSAVNEIDEITQNNAALSSRSSSISDRMKERASELNTLMKRFDLGSFVYLEPQKDVIPKEPASSAEPEYFESEESKKRSRDLIARAMKDNTTASSDEDWGDF